MLDMTVRSDYGIEIRVIQEISTTQGGCRGTSHSSWFTVNKRRPNTNFFTHRVFAANFTPDNNYVLSGSDDGNIRLWRTNASSRAGVKSAQQRQALQYADTLKQRYAHMPEIKRIARHRHVPKAVKKAGEIKNEEIKAIKRREENRRKNSKKGTVTRRPEREKMILAREE